MSKPRLVVTHRLPPAVKNQLATHFDVLGNVEDRVLAVDDIIARGNQVDDDALIQALQPGKLAAAAT